MSQREFSDAHLLAVADASRHFINYCRDKEFADAVKRISSNKKAPLPSDYIVVCVKAARLLGFYDATLEKLGFVFTPISPNDEGNA